MKKHQWASKPSPRVIQANVWPHEARAHGLVLTTTDKSSFKQFFFKFFFSRCSNYFQFVIACVRFADSSCVQLDIRAKFILSYLLIHHLPRTNVPRCFTLPRLPKIYFSNKMFYCPIFKQPSSAASEAASTSHYDARGIRSTDQHPWH